MSKCFRFEECVKCLNTEAICFSLFMCELMGVSCAPKIFLISALNHTASACSSRSVFIVSVSLVSVSLVSVSL